MAEVGLDDAPSIDEIETNLRSKLTTKELEDIQVKKVSRDKDDEGPNVL